MTILRLRSRSEGSNHPVTHRRRLDAAHSTQPLLGVLSLSDHHYFRQRPLPTAVVEVSFEPPLESPLELETNPVIPTPSSSTPIPSSIPETPDPVLEGSDEEAEHPEAQAEALRDYQLARDRVRKVPKEHPRHCNSYIVSHTFAVASYVEEREPLCFSEKILFEVEIVSLLGLEVFPIFSFSSPFLPYDELDLNWRRGAHLTRSRNTGSDWAWPPGLPISVSPI
ncbi:hypothetical protein M9H77_31444 [Catharanthus roseus]|uniref:Uncharacterized protein n=1 Tax=Catharanthus roseus TaxID=4058 RepID=A0ACC0A2T7_CATRO|nr:hypothetical protein M9H77_31444 [Catharanthus roseus]